MEYASDQFRSIFPVRLNYNGLLAHQMADLTSNLATHYLDEPQ